MSQIERLIDTGSIYLIKSVESEEGGSLRVRFAGIASDESPDLSPQQESILRKNLDLTYAQQRGFVNWDHSRAPEDQIGFLTKALVIPPDKVDDYGSILGTKLNKTASVYVEGELYSNVGRAREVANIMKSVIPGEQVGLGLSLDGSALRDKESGQIRKAIVRGVAITPSPAHTKTFCALRKSLCDLNTLEESNSGGVTAGLSYDECILFIMKKMPHINYDLAKKVVDFTIQRKERESKNG